MAHGSAGISMVLVSLASGEGVMVDSVRQAGTWEPERKGGARFTVSPSVLTATSPVLRETEQSHEESTILFSLLTTGKGPSMSQYHYVGDQAHMYLSASQFTTNV